MASMESGVFTDPGAGDGPDEALRFSRELKMPLIPPNVSPEMVIYCRQLEQALQDVMRRIHDAVGKLDGRFLNIDGTNANQKINLGETYIETTSTISAGALKFGTFAAGADTPVAGYIKIRDSSGALRKIAVVD
jgi:hypothetical protein